MYHPTAVCIYEVSYIYIYKILYNILQLYDMEPEGLAMAHEVSVARNSSKWTTLVYEPHENYLYMYINHKP